MAFINAWAATCRGEAPLTRFTFDLESYFPARDILGSGDSEESSSSKEKFVIRRFVFDKKKLAVLKQAVTSPSESIIDDPSRVEVVSAFIWDQLTQATKSKTLLEKKIVTFVATHAVDLRTRTSPPLIMDNVLGNCFVGAIAVLENKGEDEEFHNLVANLRSAIRAINNDYITKAQTGDNHLNDELRLSSLAAKGEVVWFMFSSWTRLPLYAKATSGKRKSK